MKEVNLTTAMLVFILDVYNEQIALGNHSDAKLLSQAEGILYNAYREGLLEGVSVEGDMVYRVKV